MHPSRFGPKAACLAFTLFLGWSAGSLSAQPTGGQVVAGSASIASGPGGVTITQTSGRAIINWQDFSLGAGDWARFVQPDATSATLNRVISGLPSSLAGSLEANGQVFLINPNGVLIGAGARIDTAGFLASTLDVANDAFLAGGDLKFSGESTAAVVNLGAINALEGDIFLIAQRVENHGTLTAAKGTAGLAAGSEILLTTGGEERVFVQAASAPGTVANSAAITATTAELKAAGGNAYALAIANTGVVRATGSAVRDGQLWLVASGESTVTNAGTLDVSSATGRGGKAVVTAGRVLLDDGSRINATGATGGGQVYVGGGWQGQDEAIANASAVVLQAGAAIDAGATTNGGGGEVVLWSQDYTGFYGRIAAQGGAVTGDGGRVETSSHGNLQAAGTVDISAAHGRVGSWLLDPWNVTIAHTGVTGTAFANVFTPTVDSIILASAVSSALDSGANVTITTGTTGASGGNINVNAPISWSANSTLTLQAYVSVNVNADITATGNTAGLIITPNNPSNSFGGVFNLNNRASITLSGANPSLTIAGQAYTIINSLGVAGDATTAPGTPTLQGLAAAANLGGRYALGSDIDASDTATWNSGLGFTPIGVAGTPFSGTLEGLGHTVTGLTIARSDTNNVGMFGYLTGAVRRLGLLEVSVLGKNSVGGLVGYNVGGVYMSYVGGTVTGSAGFMPIALPGETSNVIPPSSSGEDVGGLVGTNINGIEASYSFASVDGTKNVGGLVGFNGVLDSTSGWNGFNIAAQGTIRDSYATGNVSGQENVGGLVGRSDAYFDAESASEIKYVYATGNVTGTTNVGGLVGYNKDTGLLEGYATGTVSGTTNVGGLAGINEATKPTLNVDLGIYSSYWNTETTGQSSAVGYENNSQTQYSSGLTTAQMEQKNSYVAFMNLTDTGGSAGNPGQWRIYEGQTMPWLSVFLFPVTLTADSATKTYDATAYSGGNGFTYSLPGVDPALDGAATYGGTGQGATNAGSYTLTLSGFYSEQQGYDIIYAPGTLTINKANLVLTGTRVYDGTTTFGGSYLTATGVGGQTFTVTGAGATGNLTTKNVQTNQLLASIGGLTLGTSSNGGLAGNYNALSTTNSSVSVTPVALTLAGFASNNKVYDANTAAVIATPGTLTGVIAGDTVGFTYTNATFDTKDVGTGKTVTLNGVTLTGSGDQQNYTFTAVTTDLSDITPATLTYNADLVSRTYGSDNPTLTGSVTGFATGETVTNATTGTTAFTTTATVTSNVGTYAINGSGLTANNGNYVFVQAPGNATALTINKADLLLSGTRVYDGTTIFAGNLLTATGVLGETFTVTGAGAIGNLTTKHVQTNQALASVGGLTLGTSSNGGLAGNYNALAVTGSQVSVTPAALTVTANNASKTYGQTVTFGGTEFTSTGLVTGDTIGSVSLASSGAVATAGVAGSPYTISASAATGGSFAATDYTISYVNGALTVTPAALTITANNASKTYGQTTTFGGTEFTSSGLQNGETVGSVSLASAGAGATAGVAGSPYAITASSATGGTFSAANYTLSYVNGALTVTPANLVLTGTRVYDGTTLFSGGNLTATGVNGETFSVTGAGAVGNLTTKHVQTNQALASVGGLALGTSGNGGLAGNYNALAVTGSQVSVTPAALTVTANNASKTYGQTVTFGGTEFTSSGLVTGDTIGSVSLASSGAVATAGVAGSPYTISASAATGGSFAATDYTISYVNGALTVTPAALTITANNASKVYGQTTTFTGGEFTSAGLQNGETIGSVSLASTGAVATAGVAGSPYAITASTATGGTFNAANYTLSYVNGALTVTPAALTITANNASKVYGQTTTFGGTEFTASGLQNSETVGSVSLTSTGAGATAGVAGSPYAIVASGATGGSFAAANYTLSYVNGALTITPASLVLTGTRVYDGTTIFGGSNLTATGVNGETFTVTGAGASGNLTTKNVQTNQALASVGGLTLGTSGNGGLASNYSALAVTGSQVSVTPAALTVTANNASKTYGQTVTFGGTEFTSTGLVTGDTIGSVGLASSGAVATAGVTGSPYVITAGSATGGSFAASNYTISYVNGALTVTPAALTITANNASKVYGQTTTFGGTEFTSTGLQNSETIGGVSLASSGAAATAGVAGSPYTITAATAAGGTFNAANYTLSYVNGALTVTPANLVLSGTRVYDGTTVFGGGNLTATGVNGETFTVTGAGASGNLTTKHVQTNQALASVGGLTLGTSGNGGLAGNYNALSVTGSQVSVTPAALTVTASNASKTYGQTVTFGGTEFTSSGLVTGDTIGSVSLASSGAVATAGVAGSPYAITASAATGGSFAATDYTISYVNGALTVTPATLTITANNATKTYGQTAAFTGTEFTASGLVNGETIGGVTLASAGAGATASVAGSPYAIAPSAATGGTFSAANYTLSYVNGALTITPAALTITANNASKTFGQTTTFTGTEFTATGLQNGETVGSVTLASAGAVATATVAGSPYAITAASATGGTFNAANYALVYHNGVLTVTEVSAPPPVANVPLTITADNKTKIYGAPLPTFTATFAGFINGDTSASVTGLQFSTTATIGSNVGTYTITPFGATAPAYYLIGYVPGVLTINPAQLTITANNVTRQFGETTPGFTASITGFVNGDTASGVSGLTFGTAATSSPEDFTIIPSGALAANYTIIYFNGLLHIVMPVVPVGAEDLPVVVIGGEPLVTPNFAVVEQNNQLTFVSVSGSGEPDEQLAITLGEATSLPTLANDPANPGINGLGGLGGPNFGSFELVAALDSGRPDSSQASEPGLFRESSVNMGGFNVVYHEALDDARQQEVDNTALGSSYREFSDADDPQVNLVRTKVERKPAGASSGPSS